MTVRDTGVNHHWWTKQAKKIKKTLIQLYYRKKKKKFYRTNMLQLNIPKGTGANVGFDGRREKSEKISMI